MQCTGGMWICDESTWPPGYFTFSCSVSPQKYHVPDFAHSPSVPLLSLLGGRGHHHRHHLPPLVCIKVGGVISYTCMAEKAFLSRFCKFKVHCHLPLLHPHSGSHRGPCNWDAGRGCSKTGTNQFYCVVIILSFTHETHANGNATCKPWWRENPWWLVRQSTEWRRWSRTNGSKMSTRPVQFGSNLGISKMPEFFEFSVPIKSNVRKEIFSKYRSFPKFWTPPEFWPFYTLKTGPKYQKT